MTVRITGHLASELDDYYHELIHVRGVEQAIQVRKAQAAAIDRIEAIIREETIDCDFRRPIAFFSRAGDRCVKFLRKSSQPLAGSDSMWNGPAERWPASTAPSIALRRRTG